MDVATSVYVYYMQVVTQNENFSRIPMYSCTYTCMYVSTYHYSIRTLHKVVGWVLSLFFDVQGQWNKERRGSNHPPQYTRWGLFLLPNLIKG